jgi:glutamate-1-semialdehyde aminotransferase
VIVTAIGCRGSVHFRAEPVRDFRDAVDADATTARLAWLYQLNAGVFVPAGDPWTFSVAHTEQDLRRSMDAFGSFAADVAS